jgi:hypothetical protein
MRIEGTKHGMSKEQGSSQAARTAVAAFNPRPMKLSILTAALQELTPRERRDADLDLAIEAWLELYPRSYSRPGIL